MNHFTIKLTEKKQSSNETEIRSVMKQMVDAWLIKELSK